jgi:hypothetical protein
VDRFLGGRSAAADSFLGGLTIKEKIVKRKYALISFLGVCIALAALLLMTIISFIVSAIIFAISLAVFGSLSKGFKKNNSAL